jgi:hypothetical protein
MNTRRKAVLREFGSRPSRDSRKLMASRIVALEMQRDRVASLPRAIVETGFGPVAVVFAAELDQALGKTS